MSSAARKVLEDAMALSPEERAIVAVELARQVDEAPAEELRAQWVAEAVARLEQVERGEVETLSLDEVRAAVQRALER